jgi:hypothetical protein
MLSPNRTSIIWPCKAKSQTVEMSEVSNTPVSAPKGFECAWFYRKSEGYAVDMRKCCVVGTPFGWMYNVRKDRGDR